MPTLKSAMPVSLSFLQAGEVLESLEAVVEQRKDLIDAGIIERIVEPERE